MPRSRKGRNVNGFLILDKPKGLSSNAALQRVKALFNATKAGHTGSLDPLATGVLPICFGEATKLSQYLLNADKTYLTVARLGTKTSTGDAEGEPIQNHCVKVTSSDIKQVLPEFIGSIQQIPPMYSALKHKGQPLYKLAREGKSVERTPRNVTIKNLSLVDCSLPNITLHIACTKGTYIRALIDDIGDKLGCGAHVVVLNRTDAGVFKQEQSHTLEALEEVYNEGGHNALDTLLMALDSPITYLPSVKLGKASCFYLQQGQPVLASGSPASGLVRLYNENVFFGIGKTLEDGRIAPKRLIRQ